MMLLLILHSVWLVQSQLQLSLHDYNVNEINDLFFGKKPTLQSEKVSDVKCEANKCELNTKIATELLLQRGSKKVIEINNNKLKTPIKIEVVVVEALTNINYQVKYLSPYYDILYNIADAEDQISMKNMYYPSTGNSYLRSNTFPDISNFRYHQETRELSDLGEKFKCGAFLKSKTLQQTTLLAPRPDEGVIVFNPGSSSNLYIKICVKDITLNTNARCLQRNVNAGEIIDLPSIDSLTDPIKIQITDFKTPKIPLNLPDILGEYITTNGTNILQFSNLHVGATPAVGVVNRNSISALQTAEVMTESYIGEYKSFDPKLLMSWNLLAATDPKLEDWRRSNLINNFFDDLFDVYVLPFSVDYFNSYIDKTDNVKVSNDVLESIMYTIVKSNSEPEDIVESKNETISFIEYSSYQNLEQSATAIDETDRALEIFCDIIPPEVKKLGECLDNSNNSLIICLNNFLFKLKEISESNPDLFELLGLSGNLITIATTIRLNVENYCLEPDTFKSYKATLVSTKQHAFFIPIIIAIIAITVAVGVSVGTTEAVASSKKCKAQEVDIPLSTQKKQINSYPLFSSMLPGTLKEIPSYVTIANNKPSGLIMNLTNYEDQTVKLELSADNYNLDFALLKSKIQNFNVNNCKFYLSKAISTCEIIFNNVGEPSNVRIDISSNNILPVTNTLVAVNGINKHIVQMTTPEIIDKNLQICIIGDETLCGVPESIDVVENPNISGDNLIPTGSRQIVGGDAFNFWNLLNINIGFSAFTWILWIIGFVSLIILLLVLCSCCRGCYRSCRRCFKKRNNDVYYTNGTNDIGYTMTLICVMSIFSFQEINAVVYKVDKIYNSPKSRSFIVPYKQHLTSFRCYNVNYDYTKSSKEYNGLTSLLNIPLFSDLSCKTRKFDYKYQINYGIATIVKKKIDGDGYYMNNVLTNSWYLSYPHSITQTAFDDIDLDFKISASKFDLNNITLTNFYKSPIEDINIDDKKVITNADFNNPITLSQYESVKSGLSDINFLEIKKSQRISDLNSVLSFLKNCLGMVYGTYTTDFKSIRYTFSCYRAKSQVLAGLVNLTIQFPFPEQTNKIMTFMMLNKKIVNNMNHPLVSVLIDPIANQSASNIYRWLEVNTGVSGWSVSPHYVHESYSRIVSLWCKNCEVTIGNQHFKIDTGDIRVESNFCMLKNGKISGAVYGEGPRFKCLCDIKTCYCYSEASKTFSLIDSNNVKLESEFDGLDVKINVQYLRIRCFVGNGGIITLNNKGDFVALNGPIAITSDGWDNVDVIESGKIIRAPRNAKSVDKLVLIKTLGITNNSFATVQDAEVSKESTFKSVWEIMNRDYPYVIPITIAIPCLLLALMIFSLCFRFCRGGKRVMKMASYPITKTSDYIKRNFGLNGYKDKNNTSYIDEYGTSNNDNYQGTNGRTNNDSTSVRIRNWRRPVM